MIKTRRTIIIIASLLLNGIVCAQDSLSDYHNIAFGNRDTNYKAGINIGLSGDIDTLSGLQLNIFSSVVRKNTKGCNVAGLIALSAKSTKGVQTAGFINVIGGRMRGLQLSSIMSAANKVDGLQISAINNISGQDLKGMQFAAVSNVSVGIERGMQFSVCMNICPTTMNGLQLSTFNYADTLNGSQIGIINACDVHPEGLQIGLINYAKDRSNRMIGLVNLCAKTHIQCMIAGSTTTIGSVAARFKNDNKYSIIGFGIPYVDLDKDFSGALFYRVGYSYNLSRNLDINSDVGYYHVMSFENDDTKHLYSFQAHISLEYRLWNYLSVYTGTGWDFARYYNGDRTLHNRPLFEAGIILF